MNKGLRWLMSVMVLSGVLRLGSLRPMAAAPVAPVETGVYAEDFSSYTLKDYTESTEWDIWAEALELRLNGDCVQSNPSIAEDGDGNAVVVWTDMRSGYPNIYAQRLDVNGNRLWLLDVPVSSDNASENQDTPAVAVDGTGSALIVWADERNGDWDIYAQKLDVSGNKLWVADVRVNSDRGSENQNTPFVVVDESDSATVIWSDERNGDKDIYAQKLDESGNKLWAADVRVNSDSGIESQYDPSVAMNESGATIVAWTDMRSGYYDIYAQKLDSAGNRLWSTDVRVDSDSSTAFQGYSAVAVDGNGEATIVWVDKRHDIMQWDIYAQKLDGNGNTLWSAEVFVNDDEDVYAVMRSNPVVAVDADGNTFVVWDDRRNGNFDIYAQKLDMGGNRLWAADRRINSDTVVSSQQDPAITTNRDGHFHIVWEDSRQSKMLPVLGVTDFDIYTQRVDSNGNRLWAVDAYVNAETGIANQWGASVAQDGNGNVFTVWTDERNGNEDIYAQRLDDNGNVLWATGIRVNISASGTPRENPSIAVDKNGNIFVVWWGGAVFAMRLDQDGNRMWMEDVRIDTATVTVDEHPTVALDGNGNAVVVWGDERNGDYDIYAQKLDGSGNKLWAADVRVNSDTTTEDQVSPMVVVYGNGDAIVVWSDMRNGDWDIYAQKLDGNGDKLWTSDVRVNSDTGTEIQGSPSLMADGSGNAIVAWTDRRNGNYDIYAQKLDGSGNKLWVSDVRINSDTGTESQERPGVKVDGSDNIVMVWQDSRNGNLDIYSQRLDDSGNKLWAADVRVNSDTGTKDQERPTVIVDASSNLMAVWQDSRNGNLDIYAQRINLIGNHVWLADLQVVYPDRFYHPIGTTQSRTIDTVTDNIREATLTTDLQLNGGGVQFFLTNDGGATWVAVTAGVMHVFTTTGSDLRWRAELTGDPIWPRTPVVDSLRIEYSTQVPYADDYEPDDTCAQAQPLAVNGAVQAHAFYQPADEDWAWFDIISGTTYIVQTSNTQANADTELELRDACPQPPFAGDDNVFGNDARITWRATYSGTVYVKVTHHDPAVYGADTGYDLSVRTFTQPPVAVIIAGHDDDYSLQSNIDMMADQAYRTFLNSGVPKTNVRYFGPNPARDVDGNGLNDDLYATVTITGVRDAVQDWSREQGVQLGVPFYVYLVDHGNYDQFLAAGSANKVWASNLNQWLSNLEATSGADNINVILEACKSGSFIDVTALGPAEVSGHNRVVIASTSSNLNAYPSAQGGYFSDVFWTAVGENQDLKTAFEWAKQAVQATGLSQQPWLDDNGDAVADGQDGALARGRGLGGAFAGSPPVIDWVQVAEVSMPATLQTQVAILQAQVRDDFGVGLVWAEVYAPDFVEPEPSEDGTTPVLDVPTTMLTLVGSDLYSTTYPLTKKGLYRLVVYAVDDEGYRALPQVAQVCAGCTFVYLPMVLRGK